MDPLLDAVPVAIVVVDDQRITGWNSAAELLYGHDREEVLGRPVLEVLFDPSDVPAAQALFDEVRGANPWEGDFRVNGREGALLVSAFRLVALGGDRLVWLGVDGMDQQLAEEERAVLLSAEHAARATAEEALRLLEAAQHRLAILATASRVLTSTMDVEALLERLAGVLAPAVADFCVVELINPEGEVHEVVVGHQDRALAERIRTAILDAPFDVTASGPLADVVNGGRARLYRGAELEGALVATARTPGHEEVNTSLGLASAILAPIEARGVVHGVLGLAAGEGRELAEGELELAVELAHRAALAIGNARAFEQERRVAETLQRALLPSALPEFPGLDIAVRYLAAADGVDVGGDWYDVIPLTSSCVGLVIGDVVGHDVRAASTMGQVRNTLRAFVIDGPLDPVDAMARTDRLMDRLGLSLATGILAIVDVDARTVTWSNAGHPAPLLVTGQKAAFLDGGRRMLLGGGWEADATPAAGVAALETGDALVLYTDGLVERRGESIVDGLERLAAVVGCAGPGASEDLCDHLVRELIGSAGQRDDVALLVARFK